MFGIENRESTHDDGPRLRNESVRQTIDRSLKELGGKGDAQRVGGGADLDLRGYREISRRSKEKDVDFEIRRTGKADREGRRPSRDDPLAGFGPNERALVDKMLLREHTRMAVSPADKNKRELQEDHDRKRHAAAAALGFEKRRQQMAFGDPDPSRVPPGTRPNGEKSVAEDIFSAFALQGIPRIETDSANPVTLGVTAHYDTNVKPAHWDIDARDFQSLPPAVREAAHRHAPRVNAFIAGRNRFANPKTAEEPFVAVLRQLSDQDRAALAKWVPDPNGTAPPLPQLQGIPYGFSQWEWTNASPAQRNNALQEANMLILDDYATKVMANPATRLTGVKQLIAEYPHLRWLCLRYLAQGQQMTQQVRTQQMSPAERTVADWSRNKPHYSAVRLRMGELIQSGAVKPSERDPFGLDAAYKLSVLEAGLGSGGKKPKSPSGMRGGAPSGPSAPSMKDWEPQRGDTPRQSVEKALARLRSA